MYKTVLRDYRCHIKDGLKSIDWTGSGWFIPIWIIVYMPTLSEMVTDPVSLNVFAFIIPYVMGLLLSRMYGGVMPKTFFLCPFSAAQRQQYTKTGIQVRVAIPTALFVVFNILFMVFNKMPFAMFCVRLVVFLSATTACNIYCQPVRRNTRDTDYNRKFDLVGNYGLWDVMLQVLTFAVMIVLCCFEYDEGTWELIFTGILIAAQLFVSIGMIIKFYPQVIDRATFYENMYVDKKAKA